jgi:hypothetical protein
MKVWFMFDNNTFAKVGDGNTPRVELESKARELFRRDQHGIVFARSSDDREVASCTTALRLDKFFDRVDEYANWEARG